MDTREDKRGYGRIGRIACGLLAAALLLALVLYGTRSKPKLFVLMYHHVVADGGECNSVTVTESRLREDFAWLAENGWKTVLPRELVSGDAKVDDKTVLITFDDGYRSNYVYAYPLLREYGLKAEIAVITHFPDAGAEFFMTWDMMREMADSGLVEFGSHTHDLHNPETGGEFVSQGRNGVQQRTGESKEAFAARVGTDLETSFARLRDELGVEPVCFAYPFGAHDAISDKAVDRLFSVTLLTDGHGAAKISRGYRLLKRIGVDMSRPLSEILPH